MRWLSPRRWFRFSLRSLLLLVTLFCLWMGYEWNWIQQRRAALASGRYFAFEENTSFFGGKRNRPRAPQLMWLFREQGYAVIGIRLDVRGPLKMTAAEQADFDRLKSLFPEATESYVSWTPTSQPPPEPRPVMRPYQRISPTPQFSVDVPVPKR